MARRDSSPEVRTQSAPKATRKFKILGLGVAGSFLAFLLAFTALPMVWMVSTSLKIRVCRHPATTGLDSGGADAEPVHDAALTRTSEPAQQFLRLPPEQHLGLDRRPRSSGLLVAVPAAYAFSRFNFPGRSALFFSVLVRNMFPVVVFLIPLFILMKNLRLIDTHFSLILTYLTFGLPLSIWLLKGFYDNIPPELERAARIDGATRFQAFWMIVLPLSAPGHGGHRHLRLHPGLERVRLRAHLHQLRSSR